MIENIKNIKKKVTEDWQNAFPQLHKYAPNKFYKILGPVLTGIELIKLPRVEEYRPYFVIYSLWGNKIGKDLKSCLSGPIVLEEFYNKKGLQFSIPYTKHIDEFTEVLKAVKKQLPFSMDDEVSIKQLLSALERFSKTPPMSVAPNSYLQAALQENKLEIALYSGENKLVENILSQIKRRKWDLKHFLICNIDYDNWLRGIEEKISHKDELLSQLNTNKQEKKLEKLQQSELKSSSKFWQ